MRFGSALSAVAASLIILAPVHAAAQERDESYSVRERPRPEYDPLGKRFGGFTLNANVALNATSTDNVFATDTGEESDMIYSIAPGARLSSNWSRNALVVEAGAVVPQHQDFDNEDVTTGYVRGSGRLDIGTRSSVTAAAGLSHNVEPRTNPDAPTAGDPVEYDYANASLTGKHTFNRVTLTGTVAGRSYDYDGVQSYRDSDETSVSGRVDYAMSERVGLMLEASADQREYDSGDPRVANSDSDGRTILAGVTMNFTDLLKGEVSAGQFSRDYDGGGSTDGLALDVDLDWYVTGITTVSFGAHRDAQEVGGTIATPYVDNNYTVRVDHELRRNLILTAGAEFGKRDYDGIDREDDYTYADVGADYLLNQHVALSARYNFDDVSSDGAQRYRDFTVNAFTLGVNFRL